ncbi:MAG: DEAD/DEAH box helicase [Thermoplasmatota archaeon]
MAAKTTKKTFADLGLGEKTLKTLAKIGFEHPTPIQSRTIPRLLQGKDVIGQARTGSGKTAAFGLPVLETYNPRKKHVQSLVLAPTRELAQQIHEEMNRFAEGRTFRSVCIYGGTAYEEQDAALKEGVHMVVGTPGRIMDHMERGTLDLTKCNVMVLDEADRMLDMGFIEDIEWILRHMPSKHDRQTLLFSATMPEEIKSLTQRFMKRPDFVRVSADELTVPEIDQFYYPVGRRNKLWALMRLLDGDKTVESMIVFCATQHMCDRLEGDLNRFDVKARAIHGGLNQSKREKVLADFDAKKFKVLIATDVAARGLDIDHITHVVNYDLPEKEPESYVHRIGRTGRAGRDGVAISMVGLDDKPTLKRIEMLIGKEILEAEPPEVPEGTKERLKRGIDWDELADMYGNVHIRMNAGTEIGLTPFKLHRLVQQATGLQDHAIQQIRIGEGETHFAVPKDNALRARNSVRRINKNLEVEFQNRETTVRNA